MAYTTLYTTAGLRALATAEATGASAKFVFMAIGDGGGNPTTPKETQTGLVREMFRANINRIYQDPGNVARFTAELIVPAQIGGFTMREFGVFDANGTLVLVGSLPDTYKPQAVTDGAYSDVVVAVDFFVSNASVIDLTFDPNTIVVTQQWIENNVTAKEIIPGGSVGQFLGKKTNADGDYEWQDPAAASVRVDIKTDKQTLAENQTIVNLANTTAYGLAVYIGAPGSIGGERIPKGSGVNEWDEVPGQPTQIKLGKSYAAGSVFQGINNEPSGSSPAPLERDKNFADLVNKVQARTNLDVHSKAEVLALGKQWAPPGMHAEFYGTVAPLGFLKENGSAVSRTVYSDLFAVLGTTFGAGDGFNTFNLPDTRGEFVRMWDDGRGVDTGRAVGSKQDQMIQSHTHAGSTAGSGSHTHNARTADAGQHGHSFSGATTVNGNHGHAAWTDAQGEHAHSAWTDAQGQHQHGVGIRNPANYGGSAGYYGIRGVGLGSGAWAQGGGQTGSEALTSADGNHAHNIGMNGAGNHAHNVGIGGSGDHQHTFGGSTGQAGQHSHSVTVDAAGDHTHTFTTNATGGAETRPRNIALLGIIKY